MMTGDDGYRPMSKNTIARTGAIQPSVYQIRIEGYLGREWTDWFEGLTIALDENGETLLTGSVLDQAALFGLLRKVRDLGMPLVSVNRVEPCPSTTLGAGQEETPEDRPR
jgi:hypothetical protein